MLTHDDHPWRPIPIDRGAERRRANGEDGMEGEIASDFDNLPIGFGSGL